jgi:Ni/Co efflux regulator RcnB
LRSPFAYVVCDRRKTGRAVAAQGLHCRTVAVGNADAGGGARQQSAAAGRQQAAHQFTWRGRAFARVQAAPFVYPSGYAYQRWAVGAILPPLLLAPEYFYPDWDALGLDPPPPYFEWVRYGPDLLLVNVTTGEVADTIYDAFE